MYLQIKSGLINLLLEATGILHIRSSFILANLSHFFSLLQESLPISKEVIYEILGGNTDLKEFS